MRNRDYMAEAKARRTALAKRKPDSTVDWFGYDDWCVYVIRDHRRRVIYVGMSRNLFARLGTHAKSKRALTVEIFDCEDEVEARQVESDMIAIHQPEQNIIGMRGAA